MHVVGGGDESIVEFTTKEQIMKKSLKVALAAVCLIAACAFFMGCSSPSGGGYTPKYAVGDIVLNDGTKVAYSVAKDYADGSQELTDLQAKAIAVIFRADTENKASLGVGIKQKSDGLEWCIKDAAGFLTNFTETVCAPDDPGAEVGSYTFKNSPNTDGSKNLGKIVRALMKTDKNDTNLLADKNLKVTLLEKVYGMLENPYYQEFKTKYPAFEFAYYYGKNDFHNITLGSDFENGWYLPSLSELNDIFQANKKDNVIKNALGVAGGNQFNSSKYWSSSQYAIEDNCAYYFDFVDGDWDCTYKYSNSCLVCAVRAFN